MDPPSLRILQVITDTDRRGAQVFATDLDRALRLRGHDVCTVALAPGRNAERLPVEVLGPTKLGHQTLSELRRRMRSADVVVAHGSSTLPACAIASAGAGTPFVYRQISDSRFWAPSRTRRLRVRLLMGRAARVVALAEHARRDLVEWIGLPAHRIRIIPNGVPEESFPLLDPAAAPAARAALEAPEGPTALFIAALVPEKGADLAIEAVARTPGARLIVAGDGPERAALERRAADRAPGRVTFTGSLRQPLDAYAAAELVVFPSRGGDSMPAALIEAGLCGLPVITTPVGAITDIVIDGRTGMVVPVGDVTALAASLGALLTDRERRRTLGLAARRHCLAQFAIGVVAARWEATLLEVVGAGPAQPLAGERIA
ncbi:MAG: glycosyltransferase family 4 protein [Acidimicrobiales bacterium]